MKLKDIKVGDVLEHLNEGTVTVVDADPVWKNSTSTWSGSEPFRSWSQKTSSVLCETKRKRRIAVHISRLVTAGSAAAANTIADAKRDLAWHHRMKPESACFGALLAGNPPKAMRLAIEWAKKRDELQRAVDADPLREEKQQKIVDDFCAALLERTHEETHPPRRSSSLIDDAFHRATRPRAGRERCHGAALGEGGRDPSRSHAGRAPPLLARTSRADQAPHGRTHLAGGRCVESADSHSTQRLPFSPRQTTEHPMATTGDLKNALDTLGARAHSVHRIQPARWTALVTRGNTTAGGVGDSPVAAILEAVALLSVRR